MGRARGARVRLIVRRRCDGLRTRYRRRSRRRLRRSALRGTPELRLRAPNSFEQVPLATFLGQTPPAGGCAYVRIDSGSAIIYWSVTDNRTNDSAIKFAVRP